ncbi:MULTISPECIES: restriction endonuclease subunit S [unclassified Vibrio]|uniref:restriction endonuclease subunit S n=1 Tax=unclassified Vibrio TaxID=2614977 RepID=UPI003550581E
MGSEWVATTLGDIALGRDGAVDGPFGSNLPASCYQDVGIPVVRGSNLSVGLGEFKDDGFVYVSDSTFDKLSRSECKAGDIVFTKKGTLGQTGLITSEHKFDRYLLSSNQMRLRVDPTKAIPEYVYFCVSSKKTILKLIKDSESTGVPKINLAYLKSIQIELPSIEIQKEIIGHLGALNSKITLNNQINQTLEQMAQAIFKSWFVDFDPVKAKMNGEQPKGMDAVTASLFPEKLVESELGLIPEGWDVGTLSDVAKYCSARTNTDTISLENYISTENMLAEKKGVTAASKLPTAKTVAAYKSGDILVSNIRPYFKKIWLAEGSGGRSNDVLGFESVSENTDSYLMNLLYQDTFFEYMTRTSKGAKMPRGDKTAIMNWEMAVPPVELREAFSAIVDKFYQLIPQNRAQNATLESLRDTLLPKLLSGEVDLESVQVEQAKALTE